MEIGLNQLQKERNAWIQHNFPQEDHDPTLSILGAVEELGELCHHMLKLREGIRGNHEDHVASMLDSVADCVIFLSGVCTHLNADFGDLVTITWQQVQKRDWIKYPENGVSA